MVLDVFRDEVPDGDHQSLLLRLADNLRSESMPPEGEPRPNPAELETITRLARLRHAARRRDRRRTTIRRLNRTEYNNTIRELIGLDLRPADDFPADDLGYGFDTIGDVLAVPPLLVEMYLAAAERIIGEACRDVEVVATGSSNRRRTSSPGPSGGSNRRSARLARTRSCGSPGPSWIWS